MPAGSVIFPTTRRPWSPSGRREGRRRLLRARPRSDARRRSSTRRRESPSSSTVEAPSNQTRPGRCARSLAPTWASSRPRANSLRMPRRTRWTASTSSTTPVRPTRPATRHGPVCGRSSRRGGGYIATSQSATNFAFLTGAHPALIKGSLTQGDGAGGGIALCDNVGASGPLTGGYRATDNLYLPSDVTWFSALPTGATVDGRYLPSVSSTFVAGLWRDRDRKAASAPIISTGRLSWAAATWGWPRIPSREETPSASGRSSVRPRVVKPDGRVGQSRHPRGGAGLFRPTSTTSGQSGGGRQCRSPTLMA